MKNKLFIVCAIFSILLFQSCQKEQQSSKNYSNLSVTASIEQFNYSSTKTSIDASLETPAVLWESGDYIALFNTDNEKFIYVAQSGGAKTTTFQPKDAANTFSGTFACAYYPADPNDTYLAYDGTSISTFVQGTMPYKNNSFSTKSFPMIGEGTIDAGNLNIDFHNLFGVIEISLKGSSTQTVTKLTISTECATHGLMKINKTSHTLSFDEPTKFYGRNKDITSNVALSAESAKKFYVPVPPMSQSFTIGVSTSESAEFPIYVKVAPSQAVGSCHILCMPELVLNGTNFAKITYPDATCSPFLLGGVVIAPENCGKDANHVAGLLYQWGRKDGSGYSATWGSTGAYGPETDVQEVVKSQVDPSEAEANKFYAYNGNWMNPNNYKLWNAGTEVAPQKGTGDPCPTGWRVPTNTEARKTIHQQGIKSNGYVNGITKYSVSDMYQYVNSPLNETFWGNSIPNWYLCGYIYTDGVSYHRSVTRNYWTATEADANRAYNFDGSGSTVKSVGYPVRCVSTYKDGATKKASLSSSINISGEQPVSL